MPLFGKSEPKVPKNATTVSRAQLRKGGSVTGKPVGNPERAALVKKIIKDHGRGNR